MFLTAAVAVVIGVCMCAAIVAVVARRLRLPIRQTLFWFGLLELDVPRPARAGERRARR